MANAINDQIGHIAEAVSPTTVQVFVPQEMQCPEKQMEFVARIENAQFVPDVPARIVINERTGTVVANANIQITKVAVAYGSLTVAVTNTPSVSQPIPSPTAPSTSAATADGAAADQLNGRGGSAGGGNGIQTEVVDRTTTNVQEEKRAMVVLNDMPTVEDVAFALNSMGATPRELMSILQSIKDAGALNAELVLE
jgi:flagellar P-ring protein precursor FlgI